MASEVPSQAKRRFKRIVLKLSGDCLAGEAGVGVDVASTEAIARELQAVVESGVQLGVVVGAGMIKSSITVSPSLISTREPGSAVTSIATGSGVFVTLSSADVPVSSESGRSSVGRWGASVSIVTFRGDDNKLMLPARSSTSAKKS